MKFTAYLKGKQHEHLEQFAKEHRVDSDALNLDALD